MDRKKTTQIVKSKSAVKIFSVALGIALWFTVLNTTNPMKSRQITVPVIYNNMDTLAQKGLGIKNVDYPREAVITIEGRSDDIDLLSEKDFALSVNVGEIIAEGSHNLNVTINKSEKNDYNIKSINPDKIRLDIERTENRLFTVEVQPEGELPADYIIMESSIFPGDISISSLRSVISSIEKVVVPVDVAQLNRNITIRKYCKIYNKNGEEMVEYKDKYSVEVKIGVARRVSVEPIIIGSPGIDAFESTRSVSPSKVYIAGNSDIINSINEIRTWPIDITGITSDSFYNAQLNLPEGVTLYNSPDTVGVSISVGVLKTEELSVPAESIRFIGEDAEGKYEYSIITESVLVKVKGLEKDLLKLSLDALLPSVNVDLLKAGTHRLPVEFQKIEGLSVVGSYFVEVEVKEVEEEGGDEEPTPVPTVTGEPTPTPQ